MLASEPTPSVTAKRSHKLWLSICLKTIVTALVFLLVLQSVDLGSLISSIGNADLGWLWLGLGVLLLHFLIMVWRWEFVLRTLYHQRVGFGRLCYIYGLGETLGTFLPSFIGMDFIRTVTLAAAVPLKAVVQSVFVDRVLGIVALLVLILGSLPFALVRYGANPIFLVLFALSFGGLVSYALLLFGGPLLRKVPWIGGLAGTAVDVLKVASLSREVAPTVIGSGLVLQLLSVTIFWTAARMFGADVSLFDCLIVVPSALVIASLPVSLAGWGVREGAMSVGFHLLGFDTAAIVAASICYGLSGLVSGGIGMLASSLIPARGRS